MNGEVQDAGAAHWAHGAPIIWRSGPELVGKYLHLSDTAMVGPQQLEFPNKLGQRVSEERQVQQGQSH